uniref:Integrase catalytic domain-containing protein n=1 Tax=Fagus sylvatica TaxID=28930 RepID=A0A2N9H986_FAGSY
MMGKTKQGLKRPRKLPWPPKLPPLKSSDHCSPALPVPSRSETPEGSTISHQVAQQAWCRVLGSTSPSNRFSLWAATMPPKKSTRQNSVVNSHVEVESHGHSHTMGETHAPGGGHVPGGENPFGDGHVLGGGEIPVSGPQQMTLMFEMIKGMQQTQAELAESLKQLKEVNSNKEDHQNKNDNCNHEERESHNRNDAPFVTMFDVTDLLKQERERPPKEPRHFVRKPPYPIEFLKEPYPEKYDTPTFAFFDGRKGSAIEHINKFLDSMGPFVAHGELCLWEFSKSLVDRAYTWYTVLLIGSIRTWEDMVESFCSKYFHAEEKITLVNLHSTRQLIGEDLVKYIHHFRDVSLDFHVKCQEGELVEVCIDNMLPEFRAHLENLDISRFAPLLQKARKTAVCIKPQVEKGRDKKGPPQALTVSTTATASGSKRKNSTEKVYEEPPPLPFTAEEMMAIFDKWVKYEVIKLPQVTKQPTVEEKKDLQAVVSVVIHGNVSDMEIEESAAASYSLVPATVRTLQKSPKFKSLFNQLGFGPEARNAATKALITITAESGATCFKVEAHASRAFLETTNAITFTDEDMEVQHPDHRRPLYLFAVVKDVQVRRALVDTGSCLNLIPLSTLQAANVSQQKIQGSPIEVTGFGGVTKYTMGHVQLVLRIGSIVALTRFHVVNAEAPYHVLLGRLWLHKHKLVSSTYHQCVKGRLNGKPIRIAANSSPFDQTEAHFVEAALYDELSSTGDPSIVKPYVFAWDYDEMPEIDPGLVAHSLNVELGTRPVVQPEENFPHRSGSPDYTRSEKATCCWPVLSGRLARWLLQLSQYEIITETSTAIKSQAIADLLAQFPGEDSSSISHEVPGGVGEELLTDLVDSIWTLKFNGSSTSSSSGVGIVLIRENGETIAKSFKLDFSCSNNASEYEAYITRAKGEFSLKEPSLTPYRALAQQLEEKFDTFEIFHAMRCGNHYADALATLGSQISFEGPKIDITINKRSVPITNLLKEEFEEHHLDTEDWRTTIKAKLMSPEGVADLKTFKDYVLIAGVLYRRLPGDQQGSNSAQEIGHKPSFEECGEHQGKKRLYQLLLTLGYYWPTMKKDTAHFVKSYHTCQLQTSLIHTHPTSLQNMATPWPFHTWGLDHIGPINPPSDRYIWILVATEYFSKWVKAIPLRKATGAAMANFIRDHIITRFGIPHKIISDNGTPFVNKNVRETRYRAYRSSTKTVTGFTPFSLVYGTDAIAPTELLVPSPRILHGMDLEADADICAEARVADLESLEEARELAQVRSLRYHPKLASAYRKMLQTRIFAKGQMVLRTVDHVRRGLPSPSKFAPNWGGSYLIREA